MKSKLPSICGQVTKNQTMTAGGSTKGHFGMALAMRHSPTVSLPQPGQEPGERRREVQNGPLRACPACQYAGVTMERLGLWRWPSGLVSDLCVDVALGGVHRKGSSTVLSSHLHQSK